MSMKCRWGASAHIPQFGGRIFRVFRRVGVSTRRRIPMEKTAPDIAYDTERLDHLGIVAGVCREIGLAEFLDAHAEGSRQRVSVGAATVAMVLNGLGFSNRRLYLVPQSSRTSPWSVCWMFRASRRPISTTIVWAVRSIGSTPTTLRACSRE